jgi:hypothetical protein
MIGWQVETQKGSLWFEMFPTSPAMSLIYKIEADGIANNYKDTLDHNEEIAPQKLNANEPGQMMVNARHNLRLSNISYFPNPPISSLSTYSYIRVTLHVSRQTGTFSKLAFVIVSLRLDVSSPQPSQKYGSNKYSPNLNKSFSHASS